MSCKKLACRKVSRSVALHLCDIVNVSSQDCLSFLFVLMSQAIYYIIPVLAYSGSRCMPAGYILPHKLHIHILTPQKHGCLGTATLGQLIQVFAHVLPYDIYTGAYWPRDA
jgi:hypothetical protein